MRSIQVQLFANDGTSAPGTSADVSASVVEVADIAWAFDERFCKAEPAQVNLRVADEDGTIWTWLQTQLGTTRDSIAQLLPPWVVVTAGGARQFLGLVDLASIKRDQSSRLNDLSADDWSVLLRDSQLGGVTWTRPLPRGSVTRPQAGPWTGTRRDEYPAEAIRLYPARDLQVGETLQESGVGYRVTGLVTQGTYDINGRHTGSEQIVYLSGWSKSGTGSWSFLKLAATVGDFGGYTVAADADPAGLDQGYKIKLGTTDFLAPGDVLVTPGDAELVIADVDPLTGAIILAKPITEKITSGTLLKLSEDSAAQLIYQDARDLIRAAAAPYRVDLTRFQPASLPRPVHSWLPMRKDGIDLRQVCDLEPTLTQVRLLGATTSSAAYTGTPDAGWTAGSVGTRYLDWTAQRTTAPAYLMPDDRATEPGVTRARNRVYYPRSYGKPIWVLSETVQDPPVWTPSVIPWPAAVFAHDYSQFRRLVVNNPEGAGLSASTIKEKRWNGSAWGSTSTTDWPVSGWHPVSLVPMPGVSATNGPVSPQGQALLALCLSDDGTALELQLVHAGSPVRLSVPMSYMGAELAVTPWGAWMVGWGGLGRVSYSAGALSLAWCQVQTGTAALWPSTLSAIDSASVFVAGCWTSFDKAGKLDTPTTGVIQVDATTPAVLASYQVGNFRPQTALVVRDPSDSTRILGLLGGRLFQVQAKLPLVVERVKAQGMNAAEFLEFVAILHNAVLAPRPDGVLEVISRNSTGTPTALNLDQVKVAQQRVSPNFFSVCRVSTANGDFYADAWGTTRGGRVLEISGNPMVWTESTCLGVASTYVAFAGNPRRVEEQTWCWENADTAPSWEALPRWATVQINGGSTSWLVTSLSHSLVRGEARATLLEVL